MRASQIADTTDDGLLLGMNEFSDWLADSANGARVCYFVGLLAEACGDPKNAETRGVAGLAQAESNRGTICLTQRKLSEGKYEYLAMQRKAGNARAKMEAAA